MICNCLQAAVSGSGVGRFSVPVDIEIEAPCGEGSKLHGPPASVELGAGLAGHYRLEASQCLAIPVPELLKKPHPIEHFALVHVTHYPIDAVAFCLGNGFAPLPIWAV